MTQLVDPARAIAPSSAHASLQRPVAVDVRVERTVWRDAARDRDVPATLYIPVSSSLAPAPVVIFSHGIGEDRDAYEYIGRGLARRGYLTVALTHFGTDKSVLKRGYLHLYRATKDPRNWENRPLDVRFAIDQLQSRKDADRQRIAVVGHSAGAFTALTVAGMRTRSPQSLEDRRVRAVVAMSTPRLDGLPEGAYETLGTPVLHITGTCDNSLVFRTFPRHRRIPFEQTHATQQYLVTLEGVTHYTFSNAQDARHDEIVEITAAFLDGWLRGDAVAKSWFDDGGLAARAGVTVERK
ncbi:MAG: alpha/beta fold hydrolase [Thermoanaerobaculia bacterium]